MGHGVFLTANKLGFKGVGRAVKGGGSLGKYGLIPGDTESGAEESFFSQSEENLSTRVFSKPRISLQCGGRISKIRGLGGEASSGSSILKGLGGEPSR